MSSCLNALAAVTWEDMLKPFFGHISESRKTWVTRLLGKFLIMNDLIYLFIVFNATFSFYAECIIMLHGVLLKCLSIFFWFLGLTPLSKKLQLYRGVKFHWWSKPECQEKTIDLMQVTDKLFHIICIEYTSPWTGFDLSVIGSSKSIYHAITTPTILNNNTNVDI